MEDILDLLVTIQNLDDEIKDTKIKIEAIPKKAANLEKEIKKASANVQEKNDRIKEIKKTYKMKEGDIAENESKISKLNQQTFSVKTNEEYRAVLSEIDFLKKENKRIEDEMIILLEEEEKLETTITKFEKETKEFIDKTTAEMDKLKKEQEALIQKQKDAEIAFENNFTNLPKDRKELYKRIKKVRVRAVCQVSDNTCSGCYANLTHQFLNEIKKRDKIFLCESCGRILVYAPPKS